MRRAYLIAALGVLGVASFGVASIAIGQPFSTPYAVAYLKLTGGALTGGVSISGAGTCSGSDSVLYDNNGAAGCPKLTDVAPQSLMLRPQPAFPGGTQTAANVIIAGGQDESKCAIDGADPSVSCAGDNDTISMTIIDSNGATVSGGAIVVAEGTDWTATASVADTCASLATGVTTKCLVSSVAYCTATCTSPDVRIVIGPSTASMTLAESTAGCTTVTTGTAGGVLIPDGTAAGGGLCFTSDPDTCVFRSAANTFGISTNGTAKLTLSTSTLSTTLNITNTGGASVNSSGLYLNTADPRTIADDATGANATLTLTPATSYVEINCADAQGCDVTMGESGMTAGAVVTICIVAQTAGATNFADTGGVSELAGAFAANVNDCLTLRYGNTTTWREQSRSAN